jgi:hypothetical protein
VTIGLPCQEQRHNSWLGRSLGARAGARTEDAPVPARSPSLLLSRSEVVFRQETWHRGEYRVPGAHLGPILGTEFASDAQPRGRKILVADA